MWGEGRTNFRIMGRGGMGIGVCFVRYGRNDGYKCR